MKRLLLSVLAILSLQILMAQGITGKWSGKADFGVQKLRILFHIEKTDAGYSATMDSPDQGVKGIPIHSVTFSGDTCRIAIPEIKLTYTGILKEGKRIEGSFTQGTITQLLNLERGDTTLNRPQEPKSPFPYNSEEIFFDNPQAGIKLAGTLTYPSTGKRFPAVVLITGSGPQNRDEELLGHKPFAVIADYFARNGIATLRFDDRGFALSEGDTTHATSADFATDANAAVKYLKTRKEINKKKIGLAGHSEGGMIAFLVAANHPKDIAFLISMAGPGVKLDSLTLMQIEDVATHGGVSRKLIEIQLSSQRKALGIIRDNDAEYIIENIDAIASQIIPGFVFMENSMKESVRKQLLVSATPWFQYFMVNDSAANIRATKCPVLAINGDKDLQVRSSTNLAAIGNALKESGNNNYEILEYPGLNHLFQHIITGSISEYGDIEETISPEVLEGMTRWILKTTK